MGKSNKRVAKSTEVGFVDETVTYSNDAATSSSFSLSSFRAPRFFRKSTSASSFNNTSRTLDPLPEDDSHALAVAMKQRSDELEKLCEQNAQLTLQALSELQVTTAELVVYENTLHKKLCWWLALAVSTPLVHALALLRLDDLALYLAILAALVVFVFKLPSLQDNGSAVQRNLSNAAGLLQRVETASKPAAVVIAAAAPTPEPQHPDMTGYQLNIFAGISKDLLDFERDVLAKLSAEHQQAYHTLHRMNNTRADEFTQLRFLQADKYDPAKALARLQNTCEWRSRNLDPFLENVNWNLVRRAKVLRPRTYCGQDPSGRPVYAEKLGEFFSSDEAHRALTLDQWILTYSFEMCEINNEFRLAVLQGKPYSHCICYIADIGGLKLSFFRVIPLLKSLVKEVETHFPEMAGPVVLVNCPYFVTKAWGLVKKFLDPATVEKISFYGNVSSYQHTLCDLFGENTVPVE